MFLRWRAAPTTVWHWFAVYLQRATTPTVPLKGGSAAAPRTFLSGNEKSCPPWTGVTTALWGWSSLKGRRLLR